MECVNPGHTLPTEELYSDTIEATINALFPTEFTTLNSSALQANELIEDNLTVFQPGLERIVLTTVSHRRLEKTRELTWSVCHSAAISSSLTSSPR